MSVISQTDKAAFLVKTMTMDKTELQRALALIGETAFSILQHSDNNSDELNELATKIFKIVKE